MAFMSTISIIGSGITAQHLRLDVISENVTNMNTTRTEAGGAYRRKLTVFQAVDGRDFKLKYDPTDPDANEEGYVELPNVDLVMEVADAMAASQAYSANVTAFNVLKSVISSGLEIGR